MPPARRPRLPPGAVAAGLPALVEPELATLVDKPPVAGDWLYEIKLDGYRMLARVGGARDVRLVTRRGNDWTGRFPALVRELEAARLRPGWYDGEVVVLDTEGRPSFNALQNAIEGGANEDIVFYLFDLPYFDAHDLRRVPVEGRRALLRNAFTATHHLRFSEEIEGRADALLASACGLGLEGLIGKRRGSPYVHRRSDDWIKLKCVRRQEFVIGGYTWPDQGRRDAGLGALLVGTLHEGRLEYAGKVGTGFTGAVSAELRRRLDAIAQPRRPFAGPTSHDRHATWVRPELVCEVSYNEWPKGGSLRHASFKGLRADKAAGEVAREQPRASRPTERPSVALPGSLRVTNAARVVDPATGLTKMDLVRYYAEVAPWALPHLQGRPAYIRRAPKGIVAPMEFQQHPLGMKGLKGTPPELWPGHEPAILFEDAADLPAAAQLDMVEVHTWGSTRRAITQPDRMVFDLDPGEGLPWSQLCQAAQLLRVMLQELGLQSWLKTTGGKGLHVFVPLAPELGYAPVKAFSGAIVQHLAATLPQLFVANAGPRNRVGRVFIDFLRNGWVQSTAEALSARARPGLGVSMPIAWAQLPDVDSAAQWTIGNAIAELRGRRRDPWAGYWTTPQSLQDPIRRLGHAPAEADG